MIFPRLHGTLHDGVAISSTKPSKISRKVVGNHVRCAITLPVWGHIGILVVPGFSSAIVCIENTFVMIPNHCPSNSSRKGGCDDRAVRFKDTGTILKTLESGEVDFFLVIYNVVVFMAVGKLTLPLGLKSERKLFEEASSDTAPALTDS